MKNDLNTNWKAATQIELANAELSRQTGNDGRARVCARRAAGVIAGEFFERQQIPVDSPSAIVRLRILRDNPHITSEIKQVIEHFLIHTDPDHNLPLNVDLIAEARWLAIRLLDESIE